jgi:hypothetical protein
MSAKALAIVLASAVGVGTAGIVRPALARAQPLAKAAETAGPPPARPAVRHAGCPRLRATCCMPGVAPCVRPGPARALLISLGVLAGATSALILFALGDRLSQSDPGTIMVGGGALAGAGALLGIIAGRVFGDGPGLPDRVRRETLALEYRSAGTRVLDERRPGSLALRFGPTFPFPRGGGVVRLFGEVGSWLGTARDTDPRPQFDQGGSGGGGTRPVTRRENRLAFDVGADLIVALPYPLLRRGSAHLGAAELRWRPEFRYRRDWLRYGDADTQVVERTMLLPLTVGVRWHLGPRQRFTFYLGPRFDIVSYSDPGGRSLARGKPEVGPMYAEAWYDIDIPLQSRAKQQHAAAIVNSQLTVGYVHSRFDGRGFNFGPVIGFLGPLVTEYAVRVRPRGAKAAFQAAAGMMIGNGVTFTGRLGVVLPDIRRRR